MRSLKWQQLVEEEEVVVFEAEAEVKEVVVAVEPVKVVNPHSQVNPNIKVPSTLTYQLETGLGVACISVSDAELFSAQSRVPVLGRIYSRQNLNKNEPGTSPFLKIIL